MLVSGQGRLRIDDRHPRDGLLDRPGLDDGVVPVGVGDEDDALVLLLLGDPRGALLGGLGLALEAEPLLLAAARDRRSPSPPCSRSSSCGAEKPRTPPRKARSKQTNKRNPSRGNRKTN